MKTTTERELQGAPVADVPASRAVATRDARTTAMAAPLSEDVTPGQLILAAMEKGVSVDVIEKLVALKERIEDRDASRAFNRAMAAFQAECPMIAKKTTAKITTSSGGSYSYTYAELDEIVATIAPLVEKHGFSYTWDARVETGGLLTCTIRIRHIDGHSETSSFTLPTDTKSAMSSQQKQAAANTFAKRQTLISGFGLTTTDEDTDGAEPNDPTVITEDQVVALEDELTNGAVNRARFLSFMGVETIGQIRAIDYQRAVNAIRSAAKRNKERAGQGGGE